MEQAEKEYVRGGKVATYFGLGGLATFTLSIASVLLTAPISIPGVLIVGGIVAMSATEKGRTFSGKLFNGIADLIDDGISHVSEDLGRVSKWWNSRKAVKAAKPEATPVAVPAAPEAASTFKPAANANEFNNAAKPAVEATVEAPKAQPKPPAPPAP
ncbi:MAG: hypothetical protein ACAH80_02875 [Alphaproteobacteria bacterium]